METRHTLIDATERDALISPPRAAVVSSLGRIERVMADALSGLDIDPSGPLADPGAVEYASWMRLLRRATP